MKKTMMPLASSSSGKREPGTKRQGSWTRVSFLALLVLLMIATTSVTEAGIACSADAQCRRDVCISKSCASRPTTGGACETNNHCFNTATETCIKGKCLARSNLEGPCEEAADCATSEATCQGAKCLMPDGKTCSINAQCVSPSVCVKSLCASQSAAGGDCDEVADCSVSGSSCSSNKCTSPSGSTCSANSQCTSPLACVKSLCATQSAAGGDCDEVADCSVSGSSCSSNKCTSPSGASCSANAQCTSPLACIKNLCSSQSPTGGDCDEVADCATAGDTCTSNKCVTPFNPSLMVWEGNKAAVNFAPFYPSVVVNSILYVFEGNNLVPQDVTVEAYDPVAKTWTSKAGPGIKNAYFSVVAVGTDIFLIGGIAERTIQSTFYRYDTVGNQWYTDWKQLPEPRSRFAAAAVDNTVFIFGGQTTSGTTTSTIRSLDVSNKANNWNSLTATLPTATFDFSATAVNKDIYITGGQVSGPVKTVLKYDTQNPNTNPVANAEGMVQTRRSHMSFYDATSKRLYAVGGTITNTQFTVEFLDLTSPTGPWASANAPSYVDLSSSFSGGLIGSLFHFVFKSSLQILDISVPTSVKWLPFPNSPIAGANAVYMTGPNKITAVRTNALAPAFYDIATNTWTVGGFSARFLGGALSYVASAVVNGAVYVMGGEQSLSVTNVVYALNAIGDTWTKKDDLPVKTTGGCAAADGTDIYFYGGAPDTTSKPVSILYKMDTKASTGSQWSTITYTGTPTAVMGCAAVVIGQKLLIFGGGTEADATSPTGKVQSFDLPSKTWDPPFPASADITARSRFSVVLLKGFVFVIGGSTVDNLTLLNKVEVFDVNSKTVSVIADMLTPRHSLGSVTDGTSIFSVGGIRNGAFFPSFEKLRTPSP